MRQVEEEIWWGTG